jgi:hypothetical protein
MNIDYVIGHTDLGVILLGILALSLWLTRMIYNLGKTMKLALKGEDWRFPAYEFCGEVLGTMAAVLGGFFMITR